MSQLQVSKALAFPLLGSLAHTCRVSAVWGFFGGGLALDPLDPALLLPAAPAVLSKGGREEDASESSPSLQLEPWELPRTETSEDALLGLPLLPAALPLDSERLLRVLSPLVLLAHSSFQNLNEEVLSSPH